MTNLLKEFPNLVPLDLQTSLQYWDILDQDGPNILLLYIKIKYPAKFSNYDFL